MRGRKKPTFKKSPYMSLTEMQAKYDQRLDMPNRSARETTKLREAIIKRRFDMGL